VPNITIDIPLNGWNQYTTIVNSQLELARNNGCSITIKYR
jgi:hypothetical protein